MVKDEIKMKCEDGEVFDKKQIALAIRNSTLGDEIDKVVDSYLEKTTKVVNSFNFD